MEENIYTPPTESNNAYSLPIPQVTLESLSYFRTAGQWAKFLAIMGFIAIGIMFLGGIMLGVAFSVTANSFQDSPLHSFPRWIPFLYLCMAALYVFPVVYLNNFANNIKKAVDVRETFYLTNAALNIKRHFKFVGISVIVGVILYFVAIIALIVFSVHTAASQSL